jgi:fucose 4-O-acetylase-like acetyltransferase
MVIGHFADVFEGYNACKSIFLFIYIFHMPIMLFISGLFYKNSNNTSKILFYIFCGFMLKMSVTLLDRISGNETNFTLLGGKEFPWFFFVFAIYQLLMYIFRDIHKGFLLVFCILLACFVGYDKSISDYLYLSRIVIFFPFYLSGTMLTPKKVENFCKTYSKKLMGLAILIICIVFFLCFFRLDDFYVYRHLLTGRNPFSDDIVAYGPIARFMCYLTTLLTSTSIFILVPKSRIPFFTSFGAYTLNVYYWHWLIYMLLDYIIDFKKIFEMGKIGQISFMLIGIVITIIISSSKIFAFPLNILRHYCFKKSK